ncbi:uncharacterized protein LOC114662344 [Erpetoichthys calabaricus]|uniref:uncharacterized protein LOC114662344 n=1 Tax=Erpetoichthys calabaricus TaxID=27687 RepID=UPI00223428AB|nr:uncharacterized protein LOC114662344 [Erpetoichthys calabaricus]
MDNQSNGQFNLAVSMRRFSLPLPSQQSKKTCEKTSGGQMCLASPPKSRETLIRKPLYDKGNILAQTSVPQLTKPEKWLKQQDPLKQVQVLGTERKLHMSAFYLGVKDTMDTDAPLKPRPVCEDEQFSLNGCKGFNVGGKPSPVKECSFNVDSHNLTFNLSKECAKELEVHLNKEAASGASVQIKEVFCEGNEDIAVDSGNAYVQHSTPFFKGIDLDKTFEVASKSENKLSESNSATLKQTSEGMLLFRYFCTPVPAKVGKRCLSPLLEESVGSASKEDVSVEILPALMPTPRSHQGKVRLVKGVQESSLLYHSFFAEECAAVVTEVGQQCANLLRKENSSHGAKVIEEFCPIEAETIPYDSMLMKSFLEPTHAHFEMSNHCATSNFNRNVPCAQIENPLEDELNEVNQEISCTLDLLNSSLPGKSSDTYSLGVISEHSPEATFDMSQNKLSQNTFVLQEVQTNLEKIEPETMEAVFKNCLQISQSLPGKDSTEFKNVNCTIDLKDPDDVQVNTTIDLKSSPHEPDLAVKNINATIDLTNCSLELKNCTMELPHVSMDLKNITVDLSQKTAKYDKEQVQNEKSETKLNPVQMPESDEPSLQLTNVKGGPSKSNFFISPLKTQEIETCMQWPGDESLVMPQACLCASTPLPVVNFSKKLVGPSQEESRAVTAFSFVAESIAETKTQERSQLVKSSCKKNLSQKYNRGLRPPSSSRLSLGACPSNIVGNQLSLLPSSSGLPKTSRISVVHPSATVERPKLLGLPKPPLSRFSSRNSPMCSTSKSHQSSSSSGNPSSSKMTSKKTPAVSCANITKELDKASSSKVICSSSKLTSSASKCPSSEGLKTLETIKPSLSKLKLPSTSVPGPAASSNLKSKTSGIPGLNTKLHNVARAVPSTTTLLITHDGLNSESCTSQLQGRRQSGKFRGSDESCFPTPKRRKSGNSVPKTTVCVLKPPGSTVSTKQLPRPPLRQSGKPRTLQKVSQVPTVTKLKSAPFNRTPLIQKNETLNSTNPVAKENKVATRTKDKLEVSSVTDIQLDKPASLVKTKVDASSPSCNKGAACKVNNACLECEQYRSQILSLNERVKDLEEMLRAATLGT